MEEVAYNPDDPDTWSEAQMGKYIIDQVMVIAEKLPMDKIILSAVFTYAWWKSYGGGNLPTMGDVMLGITYAFTIPEALKGGNVANAYAIAMLSALGLGLVDGDKGKGFISSLFSGINIF